MCPPGYDCKDNTGRNNVLCPPGSYYTAATGCNECEAGKFCPLAIAGHRAAGIDCPEGTWSQAGATECSLCKPGMECSDPANPQPCNDGEYQIGGNRDCSPCPKNHECPFGETIAPCPLFFYADEGEGYCKACPDGKDCRDHRPGVDPVDCVGGFYSRPLDFMCVPCPRGHYCPAGTNEPIKCTGGKYADE